MSEKENHISEDVQERELGTKSIGKLFFKYASLTLIGMIANVIMVMLEGVIVGRGLGAAGFAAIGVVMPVETLNLALGGGLGMGIASLAAIKIGEGDREGAQRIFGCGFWFMFILSTVIAVLIWFNAEAVALALGATPDIFEDAVTWLRIFMIGFPFCVTGQMLVLMLSVDEKPKIGTAVMTCSAVVSLLILYLGVLVFKIGIAASGIYFCASIGLWFVSIFYFIFSKKTVFKIHLRDIKIDFKLVLQGVKIGLPSFGVQVSSSIYVMVVNNLLFRFGTSLEIAAFSVINAYIVYVLNMITQGMINGMQPIASFNHGAKESGRLSKLIKLGTISNFVAILVITVPIIVFPSAVINLFAGGDMELLECASKYTRIMIAAAAFGYTASFLSGYFQSVDRVGKSTVLGVARYLVFAVPLMVILTKFMGVDSVFVAQIPADVLAGALAIVFAVAEIRRLKKGTTSQAVLK